MDVNVKKIKILLVLIGKLAFFSNDNFLLASNTFEKDYVEDINKLKSENLSKKKVLSNSVQKDNYLIGPGDILSLSLFDAPEFSGDYSVLNDGTLQLPLIGSIYLNNLSIGQASSIIEAVQCPDHLVTGDVVIQPQSHQL